MLKFCLVVDAEKFTSLNQISPRWNALDKIKGRINNALSGLRYNEHGLSIVYKTLIQNKFPATIMLVGKVFKPIKSPNFIEFGYHSLSHLPLTLITDEKLKKEIENIYRAKSFSPPLWMVEDSKNPDRVFKALEKEKYTRVIYKGQDHEHAKNNLFNIMPITKRGKIKLAHVSNTFEGNSSESHMHYLFKDILNNLDKNAVYCLCTHDFTHKNSRNLARLINFIKKLEKDKKIKAINLKNT